jgi:hypothetical protein
MDEITALFFLLLRLLSGTCSGWYIDQKLARSEISNFSKNICLMNLGNANEPKHSFNQVHLFV